MAETDSSGGVEETIGQHADVKGACRVGQQDAEATTVSNHAGKPLQLSRSTVERSADPCRGRAGEPGSQLSLVEVGEDVVHLPETTFGLDPGSKSRAARTRVALEGGDGNVLISDMPAIDACFRLLRKRGLAPPSAGPAEPQSLFGRDQISW